MYPNKFEYAVHETEFVPMSGGRFDVAEWLTSLGMQGWEIVELFQDIVDSGLVSADQQRIPKVVLKALGVCPKGEAEGYPTKWEYQVEIAENLQTDGVFDREAWINGLGEDGWEILEIQKGQAPSGTLTAKQEPIMKTIWQALCKRAVFADATETPEAA